MITTTLAVIALAGGFASEAIPSTPSWQTDYARAMSQASTERKPMAVFIGHGADHAQKLLSDGKIPADAVKLLRESYVCVYLDADNGGKALAGQFELSEGLIISSPGGSHQAYRHSGVVTGTELTTRLTQYASAGQPTTTVSSGVVVRSANSPVIVNGTPGTTYTVVPSSGQYVVPSAGTYNYAYPTYGGYCAPGKR